MAFSPLTGPSPSPPCTGTKYLGGETLLPFPGNNRRHHFVVRTPPFWEHQAPQSFCFTEVTQQETGVLHYLELGHISTVATCRYTPRQRSAGERHDPACILLE